MVQEHGGDYTERKSDTYAYIDPTRLNLNGKSVFVSGASKGIGAAIARSFAKAGASTIGVGARSLTEELVQAIKSAAVEAKRSEPTVYRYTVDVTDPASVAAAAEQFSTDAKGHLDILVNSAGYLSKFTPIVDSDPADWWMNWEVNIKGVYLIAKYFLPIMLKDDKSDRTFVNLTSAGAHVMLNGGSGYQGTKFAGLRFTEFIGHEYGDQGVLSYTVHPGSVLTEMGQKFLEGAKMPMDDTPEVCADTVAFLTSQKRIWLQGRYLSCTWDMEEVMKREENIVENNYLKTRMRIDLPGE